MNLKCWKMENKLTSPVRKFLVQLENGTSVQVLANDVMSDLNALTFWVRFTLETPQLIAIFRNWEFVVLQDDPTQ